MKYHFEDKGTFKIVRIEGIIDNAENTKALDDDVLACIKKGHHRFVFDLAQTTYLDSAGISVFIHCLCDVQESNGSVFIIAIDNQVRKVLEMVGIDRLMKTYRSEDEFMLEHTTELV
jgi:anti-sigma B factor antagonist